RGRLYGALDGLLATKHARLWQPLEGRSGSPDEERVAVPVLSIGLGGQEVGGRRPEVPWDAVTPLTGYVYSWDDGRRAGITWWNGQEFGFQAFRQAVPVRVPIHVTIH